MWFIPRCPQQPELSLQERRGRPAGTQWGGNAGLAIIPFAGGRPCLWLPASPPPRWLTHRKGLRVCW